MHLYQYIAYIYISHIDIYEYTLAQIEYRYTRRKNHNKKGYKEIYNYIGKSLEPGEF